MAAVALNACCKENEKNALEKRIANITREAHEQARKNCYALHGLSF
jgi:hypothetical protein